MDGLKEKRARKLVKRLAEAGDSHGLIMMQGTVVMRGPGSPYNDIPTMSDGADLQNAIELGLLEKQEVNVVKKFGWEWYIVKKTPEELARNFVVKSPDSMWQQPVGEQVISEFANGGHCCVTSEGINLWNAAGKLTSCSHTGETRVRYDSLMERGKQSS